MLSASNVSEAAGMVPAKVAGRDMLFESPSAFSIFLKRLINPARKADDGWKTVKYNGEPRIPSTGMFLLISPSEMMEVLPLRWVVQVAQLLENSA